MTGIEVHVVVGGQEIQAGTLYAHRRRGTESATFSYLPGYLTTSTAYALDPELPLRTGAHQTRAGRALFGAFTDCAPDRWGRTLVVRREAALARSEARAPRALGEADFLLAVRDDLRQGALRFRRGDGPFLAEEDVGVPALTDLPALLDLAGRAERDTADLDDLHRLVRVGSSLGGARPKAHVRTGDGRIAIAKFPRSDLHSADHDTWNVMAWEKVAHDLARAAGVDVADSRLLNLDGRNVLVVQRFDRTAEGRRIGYVSAMTMLEASDGEQGSYLDIAEIIENTSARATDELHQLWRRLVFTVLVSNTDDHLRNHGFLHERGDVWRLAPAFDLNPNPQPGPTYLSTEIGDGADAATVASALAVAGFFRLSGDRARSILMEVAQAVGRWRAVAASHGLPEPAVAAMDPAFSALADV